jgi:hypothetical protein
VSAFRGTGLFTCILTRLNEHYLKANTKNSVKHPHNILHSSQYSLRFYQSQSRYAGRFAAQENERSYPEMIELDDRENISWAQRSRSFSLIVPLIQVLKVSDVKIYRV